MCGSNTRAVGLGAGNGGQAGQAWCGAWVTEQCPSSILPRGLWICETSQSPLESHPHILPSLWEAAEAA